MGNGPPRKRQRQRPRPRPSMIGFDIANPDAPGPRPIQPEHRGATRRTAKKTKNKQQPWTQTRMDQYCALLREHGRPGDAARAVGASKRNVVRKREDSALFDVMVREALDDFREATIARVQRHAWEGIKEPIYQGGELVGVKTVYSTQLQVMEAKRVVPEYRDRHHVEVSGDPIRPLRVDMTNLTKEELEHLRALAIKTALPDPPPKK